MDKKYINGWTITAGVAILFGISWFLIYLKYGMPDTAEKFGDQFGAVNALFSGLALAGVIYTLIQQQEEMSAQRREFMNSRALNIVYRQIDLIKETISNFTITEVDYIDDEDGNTTYKTHSSKGYNAIFKLQWDLILGSNFEEDFLLHNGKEISPLLGVISNSVALLLKVRQLEKMNDYDALLVFEAFKNNISEKIWELIEDLHAPMAKIGSEDNLTVKSVKESLAIINNFNEIYNDLKKEENE